MLEVSVVFARDMFDSSLLRLFIRIDIGIVGRVFTNGPGDMGSIPGRIIPKSLKMVLLA